MTEPLSKGATQEMIIFSATIVVTGGSGISGINPQTS
jgi:hypothetical protein